MSIIHLKTKISGPARGDVMRDAASTETAAPALPKFIEAELSQEPTELSVFNRPKVLQSEIVSAKRDRDFQVVEAFVAITYKRPSEETVQKRRVLASLRVGDDFDQTDLRARLETQAEAFFAQMAKTGRETMFPTLKAA